MSEDALLGVWGKGDPQHIDLGWGSEPRCTVPQRTAEDTNSGGVDDPTLIQCLLDGHLEVTFHALEGLVIGRPQEHLVLSAMAVSDGLVSNIPGAREAHHRNVALLHRGTKNPSSDVQWAAACLGGDGERGVPAVRLRLQLPMGGHLLWPVEARHRPQQVAAIHHLCTGHSNLRCPKRAQMASLRSADKDCQRQEAAGVWALTEASADSFGGKLAPVILLITCAPQGDECLAQPWIPQPFQAFPFKTITRSTKSACRCCACH
mmetsp:Transcript_87127/g.219394  ORF Transcript_87127/g.219394 Transcript_87127/m.219394 type:complete len:262 (-) Transcript_87127:140-925(-)